MVPVMSLAVVCGLGIGVGLWALLSLGLGSAALLAVIRNPEWRNLIWLLGLLYYTVLFALLLREGYRPWGRLAPSRMPEGQRLVTVFVFE